MPTYTGSAVADFVLTIAGNFFIIILVVKALTAWSKAEWGSLIGLVLSAIVIAAFVWMPDQTITFFKSIVSAFFGS